MSAFMSAAPQWFRFHIGKWLRNYGGRSTISEYHLDDLWKVMGNLTEGEVEAIVEKVLLDPAITFFPKRAEIVKHMGSRVDRERPISVDLSRMFVWDLDGTYRGNVDALTWEKRDEIAKYIEANPMGGVFEDGRALDPAQKKLVAVLKGRHGNEREAA